MSYIDAAEAATEAITNAHIPEVDTVHVALELVLHGWAKFATDDSGPLGWDQLGAAVQQVAANFHYRDPVVVEVQTGTDDPDRAWIATTRLVSVIADHLEDQFADDVLPPLRRGHWREAVAVLRTARGAVP